MKKIVLSIVMFSCLASNAQTLGQMHNEVIKELFLSYENKEINASDDVFNDMKTIIKNKYNFDVPYASYSEFYSQNHLGDLSNIDLWLDHKVNNGTITSNVKNYIISLKNTLEATGAERALSADEILQAINQTKSMYSFNEAEIVNIEAFNDVLQNSYEFWKQYESGEFRAKRCTCNWLCWVKVAMVDSIGALGFVGSPVLGIATTVGFSTFARCCVVSCCTSKRFPCEPR
jgi:hypothetical protein